VLLTALTQTLGAWSGRAGALVELEGHGREEVVEGVDLSRTVGWFTTHYPVWLPAAATAGDALTAVKERLRAVPQKGLHWGMLEYSGDEPTRVAVRALPKPQVSFNYLGQFDQTLAPDGPFGFARESGGHSVAASDQLDKVLDLNALVVGGTLSVSWRFSPEVLHETTVRRLIATFEARLAALIEHCLTAEPRATASDFPLAGLSQAELEGLGIQLGGIEDIYPATPLQQGLLFHSLLQAGQGLYINQLRLTLTGALDQAALREAWAAAIARHDILRMHFAWRHGGEALQVVHRQVAVPYTAHDWRDTTDYERRLAAWQAEDLARGFELTDAPLLRVNLFMRPDGGYDLVRTNHHVLLDGWSSAQLMGEVIQDYQARVSGGVAALPAPAPYRDYVAWLRRQPSAEDWWRAQLARVDDPATWAESLGRSRQEGAGAPQLTRQLDVALSARLQQAAQRRRVTLHTLVEGAWALVMARYGGRRQVAFGVTVAGRPAALPGIERTLGLFINSLPVWLDVPGEATVTAWLQGLQAHTSALRQYEHTPLSELQHWVGRTGEALFDSLLVFENYPVDEELRKGESGLQAVGAEIVDRTHYLLTLTVTPRAELDLGWEWDWSRLDRAGVERLAAHYVEVLEQLAADTDPRLGEICLSGAVQAARPLVPYAFRPVDERIAEQAALHPATEAVRCDGVRLRYGELDAWANQIGKRLKRLGVRRDECVGLCVERSVGLVAALLGVLKAGGAYVPLDPSYPEERLRDMLEDAGVRRVVADRESAERLAGLLGGRELVLVSEVAEEAMDGWAEPIHPEQLAYVIYTSGSTGRPKGVAISHGALDRLLASLGERPGLTRDDTWLSVTSLSFDISALELYLPLIKGARLEIAPRASVVNGEKLAELLEASQASVMQATPMGWKTLLASGWHGRPGLKGLCGGEALAPDLAGALLSRGVDLWNIRGYAALRSRCRAGRSPEGPRKLSWRRSL
jgi:non-ribosomal peptide synthase protein (TIGR01720 family)